MSGGGKLEDSLNNARKKIVKKYMRVSSRRGQKNNSDVMLADGGEVTPSSDSAVTKTVMQTKQKEEKEKVIPSWHKHEADSTSDTILAEECGGVESTVPDAAENKPKKNVKRNAVGASMIKPIKFIPFNPNVTYQYWDDPNEICERLKLLIASQNAGNTNHTQEIDSILEELGERGLIA